jgi:hypothetical protein
MAFICSWFHGFKPTKLPGVGEPYAISNCPCNHLRSFSGKVSIFSIFVSRSLNLSESTIVSKRRPYVSCNCLSSLLLGTTPFVTNGHNRIAASSEFSNASLLPVNVPKSSINDSGNSGKDLP